MITKNPSNRNALPKVIISEVDSEKILEFKIKYEKLARLDRFEVKEMHYDEDGNIIFDDVVVNGGLIDVKYLDNNQKLLVDLVGKSYEIHGKKVGGKERKYYDIRGKKKRELPVGSMSKAKVQLSLSDGESEKKSVTERELIVANSVKLYGQIAGQEVTTTKEIYLVKRFLAYRSDLLFYYGFVDDFFRIVGKEKELWKIDFNQEPKLIEYFKYSINDNLKNDDSYLKNYLTDDAQIKSDLIKVKENFSALRHALLHFDYTFFEKLFKGENVGFDFNIEFLNLLIENIDKLNMDAKKEFIEDEKIKLFGEELSLAKVYALYSNICVNRVGFNKFINSMIIEDGIENEALKASFDKRLKEKNPKLFNKLGKSAYYVDIHQNRAYKDLYIEHKKMVSKCSTLTDGQAIRKLNSEISALKDKMNQLTTQNSLSRLEHKLRLAFGFLYSEYSDHKAFKNGFDHDIKGVKFNTQDAVKSKSYFLATYDRQKPRTREKLEKVAKEIGGLNLKTLIDNDSLLKFILLMFVFMPSELKGEFLGFIRKYYHDTKSIDEDSKESDVSVVEHMSMSLKLKILSKNIRGLTLFKYALSRQVNYNSSGMSFYEEGNRYGKIYKKLGISHNQEEFDKTLVVPLLRYYSSLFKLMNDFEIYSLAKANPTVTNLAVLVDDATSPYKQGRYFNFSKMIRDIYGLTQNQARNEAIIFTRNKIAHLDKEALLLKPLMGKEKLYQRRKEIIAFIERNGDIKELLGYDAVNDFRMKVVHLRTKMRVYSDKLETIKKLLRSIKEPNDFYNIYKVRGVESINKHLLGAIGLTDAEKEIEADIITGNKRASK